MNLDSIETLNNAEKNIFDVIIIGAGLSGMYQLHRVHELGMTVRVIEAGSDVGGTWYWNRYPGARFDSESYSYGYSFSKELLQEWSWSEHFAPQTETLRYVGFVADKFDLRKDVLFNHKVSAAKWQEKTESWHVYLHTGELLIAKFLITSIGILSVPTLPKIEGVNIFRGISYHTANWPKTPVNFEGKRVAVIGTGSTGIQVIQEVAKMASQLTVFQRRANWAIPLGNSKISPEQQSKIKASYEDIFKRCDESALGFVHSAILKSGLDVSQEERESLWEKLYSEPGFGLWVGNYFDCTRNREVNKLLSQFVAKKIRQRVNDPQVAEKLIPKDHGFGTRRLPLETGYFEIYNQSNVELIDIKSDTVKCITESGIDTLTRQFEFDVIIYATGFDALTGSYDQIDIRGTDDISLRETWRKGVETFHGYQCVGFPNLLMVMGPMGALGNITRSIEYNVDWVSKLLAYVQKMKYSRIEPRYESVQSWMDVVRESNIGLLSNEVDSWMTGVNSNVEGKTSRVLARYSGTMPDFRLRSDAVAEGGYQELNFK